MRMRRKMRRKKSKRLFSKTARPLKINKKRHGIKRGGTRL